MLRKSILISMLFGSLTYCNSGSSSSNDSLALFALLGSGGAGGQSCNYSNWSFKQIPGSNNYIRLAFGNGKYVALAQSGDILYSSDNGGSWQQTSIPSPSSTWRDLIFADGKFVASASTTAGAGATAYSTDGITWTRSIFTTAGNWNSIAYGNNTFVIPNGQSIGGVFRSVLTSTDGISWTNSATGVFNPSANAIAFGNNRFVIVGSSLDNRSAYSSNGTTWTDESFPPDTFTEDYTLNWDRLKFVNNKFYARSLGTFIISDNGQGWEYNSTLTSIGDFIFDGRNFIAVGANFYQSTDGITWNAINLNEFSRPNFTQIVLNQGFYMALSDDSDSSKNRLATLDCR